LVLLRSVGVSYTVLRKLSINLLLLFKKKSSNENNVGMTDKIIRGT
jgi:hypothetical protein